MQRTGILAALLVLALAVSGCSGKSGDEGPGATPSGSMSQSSTGPGGAAGVDPTKQPPAWAVGDTWTWAVSSGSTSQEFEVKVGVLSADGATYDVGVEDVAEAAAAYPFHLVPMGAVTKGTLAWQAHGGAVDLLRFPVVDGATWTTDFWSAPGATVTNRFGNVTTPDGVEPGVLITVDYAGGGGRFLEADFGFVHGQFARIASFFGAPVAFTEAFLQAHAHNETGFTPFHATDAVRWSATAQDPTNVQPRTFVIDGEADHVLIACFLAGAVGHFSATIELPMDTPQQCTATNTQAGSTAYSSMLRPAAGGQGVVTAAPLGQGTVTIEVFSIDTG